MPNIHSTISFGLVNIPIIMHPLIKNNDTSFYQLHNTCLNRVHYLKYCSYCKKDLNEKDIVKGYEYEKDNYVLFSKEELEKLKPENEKEIEIISFVHFDEIDPIYFEKSYFLETEKSSRAYFLFCEALKRTKKVAIAKTIIGNKFYYCILRFIPLGIIMTTLFFYEEIMLDLGKNDYKVDKKELNLAIKLIDERSGKFEPEKYVDEYQDSIRQAISDKLNGKNIKKNKRKQKEQVRDLLEALEKSLKK